VRGASVTNPIDFSRHSASVRWNHLVDEGGNFQLA
jgi:hypothetical protein